MEGKVWGSEAVVALMIYRGLTSLPAQLRRFGSQWRDGDDEKENYVYAIALLNADSHG